MPEKLGIIDLDGTITLKKLQDGKRNPTVWEVLHSDLTDITPEEDYRWYMDLSEGRIDNKGWLALANPRYRKARPTKEQIDGICRRKAELIRPEAPAFLETVKKKGYEIMVLTHSPEPFLYAVEKDVGVKFDHKPVSYRFKYDKSGVFKEITSDELFDKGVRVTGFIEEFQPDFVFAVEDANNGIPLLETVLEFEGMAFLIEPGKDVLDHPIYPRLVEKGLIEVTNLNDIIPHLEMKDR